MGVELNNSILIVDEAHNLPDRIRSGLERRITERVFERALSDVEEYKENLEKSQRDLDIPESNQLREARLLEKQIKSLRDDTSLIKWFEERKNQIEESRGDDLRVDTQEFLDVISHAIDGVLEDDSDDGIQRIRMMISRLLAVVVEEDEDLEEEEQNDCIRLGEILEICIKYRNSSALALVFDEFSEQPRVTSHLLDPSVVGESIFEECIGSILMSGTLFPPEMYAEILGIPTELADCKEYSSGFPLGNRPVLIANDVTSKYTERESSFDSIIEHVRSVIDNTKGNVAVFAPSYSMLEKIHAEFDKSWCSKVIIKEEQRMSKRRVEGLVSKLYEHRDMRGLLYSEYLVESCPKGVDYSDNVLNALVCVGLPLPPPSTRQDALLEYYSKKFDRNRAWKYASLNLQLIVFYKLLAGLLEKKKTGR